MACCNGDPRMKDLNHVRILAQTYADREGISEIIIYETNEPPIGKAYNFEPAAYGRKDIVETIYIRDDKSTEVLSDNGGRKLADTGKRTV